jgi:DHA2 family multidrug resistance protein
MSTPALEEDFAYPHGAVLVAIVATAIAASLLELIDTTIVNVALRQIAGSIGASTTDVAWVITAYAISNVIIIPLSGMLSGLFGRKRYFTASIALFTVASLFCGLSTSLASLVFWRFLQGIGGGGLMATSQTVMMESFPPTKKAVALAIYGMSLTLGPAFGPTLGGFLTDHLSWHWAFFVNIPLGALAVLSSWLFIEDGRHESRPDRMDWWGILFLATFAGPLQYVLEEGNTKDWFEDTGIRVAFVLAMISLVAFVWRELKTRAPAVDLSLFRRRNLTLGVLMISVVGAALVGILYVYPLFAQIELGWDAEMSGLSIMPGAIATAFTIAFTRTLMAKGASPRFFTVVGFSLTAAFCLWMSRQSTDANWESLFGPLLLRGIALGFTMMPTMTLAVEGLEGAQIAQGNGISNMARQLGGAVGVALLNVRITHTAAQFRGDLVAHVGETDLGASAHLAGISATLADKGFFPDAASALSLKLTDLAVLKQTNLLADLDAFTVIAVACLAVLPLVFLMEHRDRKPGAPLPELAE